MKVWFYNLTNILDNLIVLPTNEDGFQDTCDKTKANNVKDKTNTTN